MKREGRKERRKGKRKNKPQKRRMKKKRKENQQRESEGKRRTVVWLCVNVLIERDESVDRETMKMQSHCTPFIQIPHSAAFTFTNSAFPIFLKFP